MGNKENKLNIVSNISLNKKQCSICGSFKTQIERKVQSPFINKKYTLYFCKDCKSYFFDKNEYDVDLKEFYNDENRAWNNKFSYSEYWSGQVKRINKLLINKNRRLNILDVGCRTGDFLLHWDKKKNNLYGVELNKNNADIVMERGINVYNDFIENIDFEIQFDVITCYALLEHIANPKILLDKITEILKTNGILVIMIPAIESKLRKKLDKKNIHWHMYSPPEHLSYYSKGFLDNYMKKRNINLVYRYYTAGGLNGIYSKRSNAYRLLKNADYKSLREYYSPNKNRNNVNRSVIRRVINKLTYYRKLLIEEYLPANKYPYYDHMYSYYRKVK